MDLKINFGCGFKKKAGFVNVDCTAGCDPDVVLDVAKDPWPWSESSVTEASFELSLERMGETRQEFLQIFKKLYSVCAPNAKIEITTLHPRHDDFVMNPLCLHPVSPNFLSGLSFEENMQQIANGIPNDKLAFELGVNFAMTKANLLMSAELEASVNSGALTQQALLERMRYENNLCHGFQFELKAIKSK